MRLRTPTETPPPSPSARLFTRSFAVELVTPLYGGGVKAGEPDADMPVRASSLRGQLRFWWRLLNRTRYPGPEALFAAERQVFGGITAEGKPVASALALAVTNCESVRSEPCARYERNAEGAWRATPVFPFGPAYVLFPGQGKVDKTKGVTEKPKPVVLSGMRFTLSLMIRASGSLSAETLWSHDVEPALRWWASFGGLGARTRRGLGAVKVPDLNPVTGEAIRAAGCELSAGPETPLARSAWDYSIGKLKRFRQDAGFARNPGVNANIPGRSRWPEADSIRDAAGCYLQTADKTHTPDLPSGPAFPRAAFGLPIITHFKDGPKKDASINSRRKRDPDDTALYPEVSGGKQDRMASPLILKPMWNGSGYLPIALLLPHDHLNSMGLRLEGSANPGLHTDKPYPAGTWWSAASQAAMTGAAKENPLQGRSGDVLADFMDFFREGIHG